jgi:hypothetical protein
MSRRFSHRTFFDSTPNALIARFFQRRHQILRGVRFERLEESEIDTILFSYLALPERVRSAIDAEFRALDAMACDEGVSALIAQADAQGDTEFPIRLSELEGFHSQVLWTFLERPRYWDAAARSRKAHRLSSTPCGQCEDSLELAPDFVPGGYRPNLPTRINPCLIQPAQENTLDRSVRPGGFRDSMREFHRGISIQAGVHHSPVEIKAAFASMSFRDWMQRLGSGVHRQGEVGDALSQPLPRHEGDERLSIPSALAAKRGAGDSRRGTEHARRAYRRSAAGNGSRGAGLGSRVKHHASR